MADPTSRTQAQRAAARRQQAEDRQVKGGGGRGEGRAVFILISSVRAAWEITVIFSCWTTSNPIDPIGFYKLLHLSKYIYNSSFLKSYYNSLNFD